MAAYINRAFDLTGVGEPASCRGDRTTANLFLKRQANRKMVCYISVSGKRRITK
jgi:hypothetical protein